MTSTLSPDQLAFAWDSIDAFDYCLMRDTAESHALGAMLDARGCRLTDPSDAAVVLVPTYSNLDAHQVLGALAAVAAKTIVIGAFESSTAANYRLPVVSEYLLEHHKPLGLMTVAGDPPTVRRFFGPRARAGAVWKSFWTPSYGDWVLDARQDVVDFLGRLVSGDRAPAIMLPSMW